MNFFLVDYENVHTNGLNGISSLSEEDKVVIFYSEKAETITFGLHRRMNESKAEISFQKVPTGGKNALDFQLCTYLGYLICKNAQYLAAYYIISGDQDYAIMSDYWSRQNVSVSLIPEIAAFSAPVSNLNKDAPTPVQNSPKPETVSAGDIKARLKALLPPKYKAQMPVIAEIVERCRTKQKTHGELVKSFHQGVDMSVPTEIYQSIKPLLLSDAEALEAELKNLLPGEYAPQIPAIAEIIRRCKTKQSVNAELVRAFHEGADNSAPSEIYRSVKPLLTDKA